MKTMWQEVFGDIDIQIAKHGHYGESATMEDAVNALTLYDVAERIIEAVEKRLDKIAARLTKEE